MGVGNPALDGLGMSYPAAGSLGAGYLGVSNRNDSPVPAISEPGAAGVRGQESADKAQESVAAGSAFEVSVAGGQVRKNAPLEDVSVTFNKNETFGFIGQNRDIRSLDVEKALDDMRKDKVLQQYQYFVGSARNLRTDGADGVVIPK